METPNEMLDRLKGMGRGDETWDLSENDINAIKWALEIIEGHIKLMANVMNLTPYQEKILNICLPDPIKCQECTEPTKFICRKNDV